MIMNSYVTFHDLRIHIRIHVYEIFCEIIPEIMCTKVPDEGSPWSWVFRVLVHTNVGSQGWDLAKMLNLNLRWILYWIALATQTLAHHIQRSHGSSYPYIIRVQPSWQRHRTGCRQIQMPPACVCSGALIMMVWPRMLFQNSRDYSCKDAAKIHL